MPSKAAAHSSASLAALSGAAPPVPRDADVGDAASPAALAKLDGAIAEIRALATVPFLRRAVAALRADDPKAGAEWALKALNQDERSGMGWYVLAVARERAGDFQNSLKAYQCALALLPDQSEVANDLGRLAFRMGMKDVAEQLFRRYLQAHPESLEAANNLACAIRDQGRPADAIDVLKVAIGQNPGDALLWNTLGTIVCEQGDIATAITFYEEAMRLDPHFAKARYNRGNARLALGELDDALADNIAAIEMATEEEDRLMMQLARSTIQIAQGHIGEGWDDYEARLDPQFAGATFFLIDAPRWTPGADLKGKTFVLMGEQGLGDEVLFGSMLPDILQALGPEAHLILAVEPRLVSLFQRSFPSVEVVGHATYAVQGRTYRGAPVLDGRAGIDLWAPLASPLRQFRRDLASFPQDQGPFLKPDPARVAHWRSVLDEAPAGRKVGVLWKSMKLDAGRQRYFSPFQLWAPVLTTPGATFVNVQYGDCDAEIAWAERELGVHIWTPPGIDLKNDLDDIAALTRALDLTVGFANATSNIAAAAGAATWIISVPGAWTRLGTERMPWYPKARIFLPRAFASWEDTMAEVARALAETA
ncbi:MAG TPA: tetratricopeptide repeat protein [Caulobacteraceae bacterium]|nr:tetratricopeptide repeat protein [Caulobacteraceae bacterium]